MNTKELNAKQLKTLIDIDTIHICKLIRFFAENSIDYEHSDSFIYAVREAKMIMNRLKGKGIDCEKYEYLNNFDVRPELKF
jgi:hypothetical protein